MTRSSGLQHDDHDHDDIFDRGLAFDLDTLLQRRRVLGLFAGLGVATLVGCSTDAGGSAGTATASTADAATATGAATAAGASCAEIPQETAGPYPGDGSNGPNILAQSGIVRSDIRSSIGSASGVAQGIPLTLNLTIVDTSKGCAAYSGAAVYLWHCTREGAYSMYSPGVQNENFLRGVQAANGSGLVTFTSIFPAAYSGRWPHIHFEVYPSVSAATSAGTKITTSQLALPKATCDLVYATSGYEASVRNLAQTSLTTDNVFRDGADRQLASMTGSVSAGYVANITVPV